MSKNYTKSNKGTAKELFEKRGRYKGQMYEMAANSPNIVDFNFGEKIFYGRTNALFVPFVLNGNYLDLVEIGNRQDQVARAPLALNFVADVFNAMLIQYNKAAAFGLLSIDSAAPLAQLVVFKGFENPELLYGRHMKSHVDGIRTSFIQRGVKFENFDQFSSHFMKSLMSTTKRYPFTKPAFIKSRYCPISCSGLAIELESTSKVSYSNDEAKWYGLISNPNWSYFVNLCNSYGFMIDMNYPMRIVADIDSEIMIESATKYGLPSTATILSRPYTAAHQGFISQLQRLFYDSYNSFRPLSIQKVTYCAGRAYPEVLATRSYTLDEFEALYGEEYFLKFYLKLRINEEESKFTTSEVFRLIDDCMEVYLIAGLSECLDTFERIINKPFDYRGSLSYIKKQQDARKDL